MLCFGGQIWEREDGIKDFVYNIFFGEETSKKKAFFCLVVEVFPPYKWIKFANQGNGFVLVVILFRSQFSSIPLNVLVSLQIKDLLILNKIM